MLERELDSSPQHRRTRRYEDREDGRPFDGPPKAARRDVRGRRYKPPRCRQRLVSAPAHITAVGVHRTPTIERPPLRSSLLLRSSCETVAFVTSMSLSKESSSKRRIAAVANAPPGQVNND